MTIIRQWAITNSTRRDMRRLMNEDERILIRGEQFLPSINGGAASWRKWNSLMEVTRKRFGHDKPRAMSAIRRPARCVPRGTRLCTTRFSASSPMTATSTAVS